MKILEAEIALREETRTARQARPQAKMEDHQKVATGLAETQDELVTRTQAVIEQIQELPDGAKNFAKEIAQLNAASVAMTDAERFLSDYDTGANAIGAETEAIEHLLKAKRSKGGGGGGGSNPGDGNRTGKDPGIAALALLGQSSEQNAEYQKRDVQQATGNTGRELPPEFREGLDKYFQQIEKKK